MENNLEEALELFKTMKYEECLNAILEIEKQDRLDAAQKRKITELKIQSLANSKKFAEAHRIVDQAIERHTNDKEWEKVLENLIMRISILNTNWKLDEALEVIDQGEEILEKKKLTAGLIESKGWLLYWKGFIYNFQYKPSEAIKWLQKSLSFAEKNSLIKVKGQTLHWLGNQYGILGEYDLCLKYQNQALQHFRDIGDEINVAHLLHNMAVTYAEIGNYKKTREFLRERFKITGEYSHGITVIADSYWREGELEKGLEYIKHGLEKFKNVDQNFIVTFILANLNSRIGKMDEAKELYEKTIRLASVFPRVSTIGFCHVGISTVYYFRGELDKALEHANESLRILEKCENKYGMGWAHFSLMKIYHEKDDYENALLHGQTCLDLRMAMGNNQDIAQTLRFLITFLLEREGYDETDSYLKQLKELTGKTDNRIVRQNYQLSEALILKAKGRPKHWTQAIDILEEIVREPIATYNTTLVALINLCEILLNEYSISGDEEVLNDLQTHTSRLLDIAQKQNSYRLRVEAYHIRIISLWLQAQHSKLDINIQNARRLLQEARDLADSHGLMKLASKITTQYDIMLEKLVNWDDFIKKYYEFIKQD
jgi:tetratricopeptide (TPR) repeat protein